MRRAAAIAGSAVFLVVAPGTIAVWVPWTICRWRMSPPLLGIFSLRVLGALLIAAGLPVLLDSFARFALQGLGTPAPVAPPRHLVVTGLYRYVRNPMYVAVSSLIFGQGLLFGSVRVLEYGMAVWLGFHLFVLLYEEPTLRAKFGDEYQDFCANVRRWIPRLRPWRKDSRARAV
jgi:protein-S-isoprenylcysteine O-methyltransferase Ste14